MVLWFKHWTNNKPLKLSANSKRKRTDHDYHESDNKTLKKWESANSKRKQTNHDYHESDNKTVKKWESANSKRKQTAHDYHESDNKTVKKWELIARNPREVKWAIRHGIPDWLRGNGWQIISGGRELLLANPGIYSLLLSFEASESEKFIVNDLCRTIRPHGSFRARDGSGQRSLYNVLKAYSVYDKDVGYTQGMNFIADMILLYMGEEEAFWVMVALLKGSEKTPLRGLYAEKLPLLHQCLCQFEMLVKKQLPILGKHFEEQKITPLLYATRWFMTVFTTDLPLSVVVRIWDAFLYEGVKTIFGVGLALLKLFEKDMLKFPLDGLLQFLRRLPQEKLDPDILLPMAYSMMEMIEIT